MRRYTSYYAESQQLDEGILSSVAGAAKAATGAVRAAVTKTNTLTPADIASSQQFMKAANVFAQTVENAINSGDTFKKSNSGQAVATSLGQTLFSLATMFRLGMEYPTVAPTALAEFNKMNQKITGIAGKYPAKDPNARSLVQKISAAASAAKAAFKGTPQAAAAPAAEAGAQPAPAQGGAAQPAPAT